MGPKSPKKKKITPKKESNAKSGNENKPEAKKKTKQQSPKPKKDKPEKGKKEKKTKNKKGGKHKSSKKKKGKKQKVPKPRPDPFSAAAMENVYYISHNVADFLTYRGFKWVGGKKGKGRGGKKKKK